MQSVETFLTNLREALSKGVAETSGYPALRELLNAAGKDLKPEVRCVIHPRGGTGEGIADGAFFSKEESKDKLDEHLVMDHTMGSQPRLGQLEVKGLNENLDMTEQSDQIRKYLDANGLLLLTNYWEYRLLTKGADGNPVCGEVFRLAESAQEFREALTHPRKLAKALGPTFADFLQRVMRHQVPLEHPKDVAWYLASYARLALARLDREGNADELAALKAALTEALGITFTGEEGEHFFRSSVVQTLFYGVFAAWVYWRQVAKGGETFNWKLAIDTLHVPVINALYHQVSGQRLKRLKLDEILEWTGTVLQRTSAEKFFQHFRSEEAVQYFYEPFLQEFDPALRKQLGVWYTPPEIVEYMVARVDRVLREELGIAEGLAGEEVYILDPCCGTGSFLVEVLRVIRQGLEQRGLGSRAANALKAAAQERVLGFELLPAPFVIAHLQLGMLLHEAGAPLAAERDERVGVYLTNALTGWDPPREDDPGKQQLMSFMPELVVEQDAARTAKQKTPILVVLGNPPYNAFAGVSPEAEGGQVEVYKQGLREEWGIKKYNLDDLYVRFFRLAERRIAEMSGKGIICYISNFSWIGNPSFVVFRQRFLNGFDSIWVDCLNGDSRETGKVTPEGKPDPSVFSTNYNPEGIRVGTAIGLMVRKAEHKAPATVHFQHYWGVGKRAELVASLTDPDFESHYAEVSPRKENRWSFRPGEATEFYLSWPRVTEQSLFPPENGLMEKRGGAMFDISREKLEFRIRKYMDEKVSWDELQALGSGLTKDAAGHDAKTTRDKVIKDEGLLMNRFHRYLTRPFDVRWCYYTPVRSAWNANRPKLYPQLFPGNAFVSTRPSQVTPSEGVPFYFTTCLPDNDALKGHAYYIPLTLRLPDFSPSHQVDLPGVPVGDNTAKINLSDKIAAWLSLIGARLSTDVWYHVLAIGYSPAYLTENADGIRLDWPRIPLPATKDLLEASAALGRQVAALLDPDTPVPGVTTGTLEPPFASLGVYDGPTYAGAFALTAGWGHPGKGGITMPAKGKRTVRNYTPDELAALQAAADARGLSLETVLDHLGHDTCDVWLNDAAKWVNVPSQVWEYYIGGYQVIKKWLSYREEKLLGRPLNSEEMDHVMHMIRRLAALRLMEPALDANYQAVKANTYPWPHG